MEYSSFGSFLIARSLNIEVHTFKQHFLMLRVCIFAQRERSTKITSVKMYIEFIPRAAQFNPSDTKLMVAGVVDQVSGEIAIFKTGKSLSKRSKGSSIGRKGHRP